MTDHHDDEQTDSQRENSTMGNNPGGQGDFASGQDDEGQHAEQAIAHDESLEERTDDEVDPSTEREQPTPKHGDEDDDAHANEPRTDEAAPPAQGPAA